jgi:transcriptional regulator with XRE-family HTH domain
VTNALFDSDDYDAVAADRDLATQIGQVIRKYREDHGVTQVQLAGVLGSNQATIVRIEKGQASPQLLTLIRLSHVLGISLSIDIGPDGASAKMKRPVARKAG